MHLNLTNNYYDHKIYKYNEHEFNVIITCTYT